MNKTKFKTVFVLALLSLITFSFASCEKENEATDLIKTGVYKVVIDLNKVGDEDVILSGTFVTATNDGKPACLYNNDNNNYIGENYSFVETMDVANKTIAFYTSSDAISLFGIISFGIHNNTTFTYSIKGYYNNKLIKEKSNTISPTTETMVTISEEIDLS